MIHNWSIKGCGMCCPVCEKVHIKDPLLPIRKSSLYGGSRFCLKKSLLYLTTPLKHIEFHIISYLDIKHMVIVIYFCRGNLLSSHWLLFPIAARDLLCTLPHRLQNHNNCWFSTSVSKLDICRIKYYLSVFLFA